MTLEPQDPATIPKLPCVVCRAPEVAAFAEVRGVPVNCSATLRSRAEALDAPRGDVVLGFCRSCGTVRNLAFDPALLSYGEDYENSLHASPSFQRFAEELADRLIREYGLRDRDVLEIGSGKGEFLQILCERGHNRGTGFDPTYVGEAQLAVGGGVRFVTDLYDESYSDHPVDLVCCRHVFEHLEDPAGMLASLRRTIGERRDTVLYFEVPDAEFVLGGAGMWDVIYPHCSYFAEPALRRVFEDQGFEVRRTERVFGAQFLALEAVPRTAGSAPGPDTHTEAVAALGELADAFAANLLERRKIWSERLEAARAGGSGVALWGAGAKAVTFLNAIGSGSLVEGVVDLNPRKHGTFVPGTGQEVMPPEALREQRPSLVLITNPMYREEIQARLDDMNVEAEIHLI